MSKQLHTIHFNELPSQNPDENIFHVNDDMYLILKSNPVCYGEDEAYVFGHLYPLDEYKEILWHGNDHASTGFLDLTLFQQLRPDHYNDDQYDEIVECTSENDYLAWIRMHYPEILWLGTTPGDTGATLYAHYDNFGDINGLIVEINHFFAI